MEWRAAKPAFATADSRHVTKKGVAAGVRQNLFVYAFSAAMSVTFITASVISYLGYLEPRFDLGNMVQTVWSTANGHFLRASDPTGADMSRLGAHFDPFLALLAPLWLIWSNPIILLSAQAIAVSSGALPVYWLARKHLGGGGFAVVFAVVYLLYPPTQFNASSPIGFHAVSFAIPLLLYAIWFLDEGRLALFAVFAVVAATTKEEIAAAIGGLGLWYAFRKGRHAAGWLIFTAGIVITVVNLTVVIPHFADGAHPFLDRYSDVGGTPQGIARTLFTDPQAFAREVASWHKLAFVVLLFAPFLFLWAFEPLMLAGAVPDLVIDLLSSKPSQTSIFYQYTSGIVPFVIAASILGAAKLRRRRHVPTALLTVVGCIAGVSPLVFAISNSHTRVHSEVAATKRALALVPPDTPVSASNSVGAYVSTRRSVATFPNLGQANWVIVGPATSGTDDPKLFARKIREIQSSPQWQEVFHSRYVIVFTRHPQQQAA